MNEPTVHGRCPACGHQGLVLEWDGRPRCSRVMCPDPDAAAKVLNLDHRHVLEVREDGWSIEHPVVCRLDDRRLLDCTVHRMVQQDLDGRERPSHPGRYWINPLPAGGFGTEKIES